MSGRAGAGTPGRGAAALLAAALLAAALAACSGSSTFKPLTVSVRDKLTRQPLSGAVVHARTTHWFLPMAYIANKDAGMMGRDPILDGSPPRSEQAITTADGTARLKVIVDHPVQIIVLAAGYEPQTIDVEAHPAITGVATDWLDTDPGPGLASEPARLEVRLSP